MGQLKCYSSLPIPPSLAETTMRLPLPLALCTLLILSVSSLASAEETAWKSLFNGKDLTGWEAIGGPARNGKSDDGVLSCGGGMGHAWLSTTDQYKNFELELEFRLPPGGNSGVFLRAPHRAIRLSTAWKFRCSTTRRPNTPRSSRSSTAAVCMGWRRPSRVPLKPAGEWQKYLILCDGQHVKVTLNGTVVVDANLADYQNDAGPSRRQADRRLHRPAESQHADRLSQPSRFASCRDRHGRRRPC